MRLDRAATLYFFHPLTREFAGNGRPRMSVLMYHSVSNGNEDSVHPYYTALLAHALMFGVGWAAGLLLPRRRPPNGAAVEPSGG